MSDSEREDRDGDRDDDGVMFIGRADALFGKQPDPFDWLFDDPELPGWATATILLTLIVLGLGAVAAAVWQGAAYPNVDNVYAGIFGYLLSAVFVGAIAAFGAVIAGAILLAIVGGLLKFLVKVLRLPANLAGVLTIGAFGFGIWKVIEALWFR